MKFWESGERRKWNDGNLRVSVERLMQRKGIARLEEEERNMAVPATETPPIPATHEARRWRTAALIGGMWKVLAAHHDAISFSLDSLRHEGVHGLY